MDGVGVFDAAFLVGEVVVKPLVDNTRFFSICSFPFSLVTKDGLESFLRVFELSVVCSDVITCIAPELTVEFVDMEKDPVVGLVESVRVLSGNVVRLPRDPNPRLGVPIAAPIILNGEVLDGWPIPTELGRVPSGDLEVG